MAKGIDVYKVLASFALLSIIAAIFTALLFKYQWHEYQLNDKLSKLNNLHKSLLSSINAVANKDNESGIRQLINKKLNAWKMGSNIVWLRVYSEQGQVLYQGPDSLTLDEPFDKELSTFVLADQQSPGYRMFELANQKLLVSKIPQRLAANRIGEHYFVYATHFRNNTGLLWQYAIYSALAVALLVFLIVVAIYMFARDFLRLFVNTEKREEQLKLEIYEHASYHDSLTGLPNRTMLLDRISHAIAKVDRSGDMLAVLYIDVDRFNLVNSSVGYQGGDQVISILAERLSKSVRECDTTARINGDEFALLIDSIISINEAAYVAKRIQKILSKPFIYNGEEVSLGASIGIAIYPNDGKKVENLLANADAAMQLCKRKGGASFQFYTSDMNKASSRRLSEEKRLRDAIVNNEYRLYFQPKVNVGKCAMVGAEVLLRWQKDNKNLVAPDHFISMLEESGLILPVGEWVLHQACLQGQRWIEQGNTPIPIAVNVSARQFKQLDFVDVVYSALEKSGFNPEYLEIEVTEGVLMEDTKASRTILEELRALGVSIAIDDFGTGYSSLAYLRSYPVNTLKIDKSFIGGVDNDSEDAAIATTIVALAHNLKLNIVAEGVENIQQMAFLSALGCHELQGYLFSRPLSAPEFEKFLKNNALLFANVANMMKNRA